jgi:tRNA modification GTPase
MVQVSRALELMPDHTSDFDDDDTICAVATPPGRSGIAIVRCSGPQSLQVAQRLAGKGLKARNASLRPLRHPETGETIDHALTLVFPGPKSFTGEDMVEFHVHGSRAVVADLIAILTESCGLRVAEPGEFTRRAFDNGRLDLTRIEAMADLIEAETTAQRRQAIRNLDGALHQVIDGWREDLIRALSLAEGSFDFSDEGDIADGLFAQALELASATAMDMARVLDDNRLGERIRDGLTIVIAGPPNAGKSTLLNRLARRDVAITSDIPGTTRDSIEVHMDLAGIAAVLIDTAGLRQSEDPVEIAGVNRARQRIASADLVLEVVDATVEIALPPQDLSSAEAWLLFNKSDLRDGQSADRTIADRLSFSISAKTGAGVDDLLDALTDFGSSALQSNRNALITRRRHRDGIAAAHLNLQRGLQDTDGPEDARTERLRDALQELGRLSGAVDPELVLDRIFSEFCIGK